MLERRVAALSRIAVTEVSFLRYGCGVPFNILTITTDPPPRIHLLNEPIANTGSDAKSPELFCGRGGANFSTTS